MCQHVNPDSIPDSNVLTHSVMIQLLAEMKMEKDFFPVGREVSGIVLEGKYYLYFLYKRHLGQALVAHAFNPSTLEAEAGGSL